MPVKAGADVMTQTRLYRRDFHTVNSLYARQLGLTQTEMWDGISASFPDDVAVSWASDVCVRSSAGVETLIGANVAEVVRSDYVFGIQPATWNAPSVELSTTDALVVTEKICAGTTIGATASWVTEQLEQARILNAAWTFYRFIERVFSSKSGTTFASFYFSGGSNSRIDNIVFEPVIAVNATDTLSVLLDEKASSEVVPEQTSEDASSVFLDEFALRGDGLSADDAVTVSVNETSLVYTQDVPWGIRRVFRSEYYPFCTWDRIKGQGIAVAVLDTGIDATHPDLRVVGGINAIDTTPWSFDGFGHGTHVAGIIAALDNDFGVVGVAPRVDLFAIKVLDSYGSGTWSSVIAGIEWAVNAGIPIISMSLGGTQAPQSLADACAAAYARGHLLIAAVGNSGNAEGTGDNVLYPARYPEVIAVAASDVNDRRASFSSTGPTVELIAPGVDIRSTLPMEGAQLGREYGVLDGTSMACPHVAGIAALIWGANPALTNIAVREILLGTAQDLGLPSTHQGYGLARADLAVFATPLENITGDTCDAFLVDSVIIAVVTSDAIFLSLSESSIADKNIDASDIWSIVLDESVTSSATTVTTGEVASVTLAESVLRAEGLTTSDASTVLLAESVVRTDVLTSNDADIISFSRSVSQVGTATKGDLLLVFLDKLTLRADATTTSDVLTVFLDESAVKVDVLTAIDDLTVLPDDAAIHVTVTASDALSASLYELAAQADVFTASDDDTVYFGKLTAQDARAAVDDNSTALLDESAFKLDVLIAEDICEVTSIESVIQETAVTISDTLTVFFDELAIKPVLLVASDSYTVYFGKFITRADTVVAGDASAALLVEVAFVEETLIGIDILSVVLAELVSQQEVVAVASDLLAGSTVEATIINVGIETSDSFAISITETALVTHTSVSANDTGSISAQDIIISVVLLVTDTFVCALTEVTQFDPAYFVVSNGVLRPLNVLVLRDSRFDLLPTVKNISEEIPGKHGEISFGSRLLPRVLELHVAVSGEFSANERERIKRNLAKYLNPTLGVKSLVFTDDIEKTYYVKYAGSIDLKQRASWFEFTMVFKGANPYILSTFDNTHVGSGVVRNKGNVETPFIAKIVGPATNPSITVGTATMQWSGSITSGKVLEIDTEKLTVTYDGANALSGYNRVFPKLPPGETSVAISGGGNAVVHWRDRWV